MNFVILFTLFSWVYKWFSKEHLHDLCKWKSSDMEYTKQFQNIAVSTALLLTVTLVIKARVNVEKDRVMFFSEQLTKVVALLMGNLPYILFQPKAETNNFERLFFWATKQ